MLTRNKESNERKYMEMSIVEARKCKPATDRRPEPKVGAVAVKEGEVLATAFRGEGDPDKHAEQILCDRGDYRLAGSTVFTTLEPSTHRSLPKEPCVERLIKLRVARVVIGTIDPNPSIGGKGIIALREAGKEVALYDPDLMEQIEALDCDFRKDQTRFAHWAPRTTQWDVSGIWLGQICQTETDAKGSSFDTEKANVGLELRQTQQGVWGHSIVVVGEDETYEEDAAYGALLSDKHFTVVFFTRKPGFKPSFGACMFAVSAKNRLHMYGFANISDADDPTQLMKFLGELERRPELKELRKEDVKLFEPTIPASSN